jgi:FtsH-binding integral membrane protein
MDALSLTLLLTAAGVAVTHTLLGPDHYLPFIMLARARAWSIGRTLAVTVACGVGHVMSSLALGLLGSVGGVALGRIEQIEEQRGNLAAWVLVSIGLAYGLWGARQAIRQRTQLAAHPHGDHVHLHAHGTLGHDHGSEAHTQSSTTFWALFIAFVLGPCEPLIPLFLVPASRGRWDVAIAAAVVFGVVTIATMVVVTLLGVLGIRQLPLGPLARWSHAVAGSMIALSGAGILVLGL